MHSQSAITAPTTYLRKPLRRPTSAVDSHYRHHSTSPSGQPSVTPAQPTQSAVDAQGEAMTGCPIGLHQVLSKHVQKQVSDTVPAGQASCERGQLPAPV